MSRGASPESVPVPRTIAIQHDQDTKSSASESIHEVKISWYKVLGFRLWYNYSGKLLNITHPFLNRSAYKWFSASMITNYAT